jgi:hypothetical protein
VGMLVGDLAVPVRQLAVFERRVRVNIRLVVLTGAVVVSRLAMVMRGVFVVRGGVEMVLVGRVFGCHSCPPSLEWGPVVPHVSLGYTLPRERVNLGSGGGVELEE